MVEDSRLMVQGAFGSWFMINDFNLNVDDNLNKLAHRNHIKGCGKVNLN